MPVQEADAIANGCRPGHHGEVRFEGLQIKFHGPVRLDGIHICVICTQA